MQVCQSYECPNAVVIQALQLAPLGVVVLATSFECLLIPNNPIHISKKIQI